MKSYRWLERLSLMMILALCTLLMANQGTAAEAVGAVAMPQTPCINVQRQDYYELKIRKSGRYCWTEDIKRTCPPSWVYLGEARCQGIGIDIYADDVELDFQGHTLTSKDSGIGIDVYSKRVTIHNGVFIGSTKMTLFTPKGPPPFTAMPDMELRSVKLLGPGKPESSLPFNPLISYEDLDAVIDETGYVIENMVIDSKVADTIRMNGTGNIVRNNRFRIRATNPVDAEGKPLMSDKSGSPARYDDVRVGIINYGANTLIENNEIIQTTDNKGVIPAYSIYLRKADGSIVRGNTVKLSGTKKKTIAIGLRDTQNAVIENNKIIGAETPIEQVGETSSQQNNNQVK